MVSLLISIKSVVSKVFNIFLVWQAYDYVVNVLKPFVCEESVIASVPYVRVFKSI